MPYRPDPRGARGDSLCISSECFAPWGWQSPCSLRFPAFLCGRSRRAIPRLLSKLRVRSTRRSLLCRPRLYPALLTPAVLAPAGPVPAMRQIRSIPAAARNRPRRRPKDHHRHLPRRPPTRLKRHTELLGNDALQRAHDGVGQGSGRSLAAHVGRERFRVVREHRFECADDAG